MGPKQQSTIEILKLIEEDLNNPCMRMRSTGMDERTLLLLGDIALSLAIIADKLTEDDNAKNERNEEVSMRPVPGEDMVASESMEDANVPSSSDIQKDDYKNDEGESKAY